MPLTRVLIALLACLISFGPATAKVFDAESFTLENGLQVIVVTNDRAPVVTQMIWYRVGAADETPGKSGLAHFLEHLMFKGTTNAAPGEFRAAVAAHGGRENAFTSRDYTAYWQTVAKEQLELVMSYEADRMENLLLDEDTVARERDVILEERRHRVDNNPSAQLDEAAMAALFRNHPYGVPIIGWEHEMADLTLADAEAFYRRWYSPDNAILILSGDITLKEARPLVETYYGSIPARGTVRPERPLEPPLQVSETVTLETVQASEPQWSRAYLGPLRSDLEDGDLLALQILAEVLGGGPTSRLYESLVIEQALAASIGAYDRAEALDYITFHLYATPRPGVELSELEAAIEETLRRALEEGISEEELRQAKDRLQAGAIFARDDPVTATRVIGTALAIGRSLDEVQDWPERVEAVTLAQVNAMLHRILDGDVAVTGYLLPREPA